MTLVLKLSPLPFDAVAGIYTIRGVKGRMPDRALWLHPLAAQSYLADLADGLVVSDLLRSAESSLNARRRSRGAQAPGFSLHNYGIALDLDTGATMKRLGFTKKADLDAWMRERGWYCHRVDGKLDHEAWHYNYLRAFEQLGDKPVVISTKVRSTAGYAEALITRLYGPLLAPVDLDCQVALQKLRIYGGAIDGDIGPLSREATRVFQRAWDITETGKLDARTRRTLAFVACEREVVS